MNKYYFTFGSDIKYPFHRGHVCVLADSMRAAARIFNKNYPPRENGWSNYAFSYDETVWNTEIVGKFPSMEVCHAILQ